MMALGLIRSVEDAETFLDSYAFYQFVWDKVVAWTLVACLSDILPF